MSFMRFLSGRPGEPPTAGGPAPAELSAETETVRRIVARLEALPPETARLLACLAYVLARAAYADLEISDAETVAMEHELNASGLDPSQAVLVVEMAKLQEKTGDGTSDYGSRASSASCRPRSRRSPRCGRATASARPTMPSAAWRSPCSTR